MVTKEDELRLRTIFSEFDRDGNGVLSPEELIQGYRRFGLNGKFGLDVTEEDIEQILDMVDINRDGEINYSEFITAAHNFGDMVGKEKLK